MLGPQFFHANICLAMDQGSTSQAPDSRRTPDNDDQFSRNNAGMPNLREYIGKILTGCSEISSTFPTVRRHVRQGRAAQHLDHPDVIF